MKLSFSGAREHVVEPNYAIVQCDSAMWTYQFYNGYIVTHHGPFAAHVFGIPDASQNGAPVESAPHSAFSLKIHHIQFDSDRYEMHYSADGIPGSWLDVNKIPQVLNPPTSSQRDDERSEEPWIPYEYQPIPEKPVNNFGIPQATLRVLEVRTPILDFRSSSPKNPHGLLAGGECLNNERSHAVPA
jgi:hypothetical protein